MEITWKIISNTGTPVTGGAASTVLKLRRVLDGFLYDWSDDTFKASGWGAVSTTLSEVDGTNLAGVYAKTVTVTGFDDGVYQAFADYTAATPNLFASTEISIIDGKLAFEALDASIVTIDGKVDVIDGNVDDVETLLNTVDGKIDTVDTVVDRIEVDTTSIESKVDTVDTVVDRIEVDTTSIESKVDIVDTVVDRIEVDTTSIESKVDIVDTVVDRIEVDTTSIESKIDTVDTVVDRIEVDTTAIESKVDVIDGNVDGIETLLNTVDAKVDIIDTNVDSLLSLVGGSGLYAVTLQLYETATTTPLSAVHVAVYAGSDLDASGDTNTSGQVVFHLDAGTYDIRYHKAGVTFSTTDTITVTGDATVTRYGTPVAIPVPSSGNACTLYDYCYDQTSGSPMSAVTATAKITALPYNYNGKLHTGASVTGTYSAVTGLLYWDIAQGATALVTIEEVGVIRERVTIPAQGSVRLGTLLS